MKNSTDVWFIAFLMMNKNEIKKFDVIDRGKVRCFFDLTDEQWHALKLKYNNSEVSQYKALIEKIKDLSY